MVERRDEISLPIIPRVSNTTHIQPITYFPHPAIYHQNYIPVSDRLREIERIIKELEKQK